MKLTIERSTLLKSLGHVQSVVGRRNTIPILANVRLEASDDALGINATDMDLEIIERTPAVVIEEGRTTAPAHTLYDIVRKLPKGAQVEIAFDGDSAQLVLRAGLSRFTLACLPVEDFPVMAGGDLDHAFAVSAADLRGLIDRTRFAISTEETRYYLNGIYFHAARSEGVDVLRAVATDGHRLARVEVPLPEGAIGMPGVIIPRKTVNELRKLIDKVTSAVHVSLSSAMIRFAFDEVVLTSNLIDGTFPDYKRLIPAVAGAQLVEYNGESLAAALAELGAKAKLSRAGTRGSLVACVQVGAGTATFTTETSSVSVAAAGDCAPIGVNAHYLLDAVVGRAGSVRVYVRTREDPILIRYADGSSSVLMPHMAALPDQYRMRRVFVREPDEVREKFAKWLGAPPGSLDMNAAERELDAAAPPGLEFGQIPDSPDFVGYYLAGSIMRAERMDDVPEGWTGVVLVAETTIYTFTDGSPVVNCYW